MKSYITSLRNYERLMMQIYHQNFDNNKNFQAEQYWIDLYIKNQKNDFGKLAKFFINILLISHSNCCVERIYSLVNIIKSSIRNQLDVETSTRNLANIFMMKKNYLNQMKIITFFISRILMIPIFNLSYLENNLLYKLRIMQQVLIYDMNSIIFMH